MTVDEYRRARAEREARRKHPRAVCRRCRKAQSECYCGHVKPFTPPIKFVILMHHEEAKRAVATGRMTHLFLENSELIEGVDFSKNPRVNALLEDPRNFCMVLYPSPQARDIGALTPLERRAFFPAGRQPVIFLIDGTWSQARRMRRLSPNLGKATLIRFVPEKVSRFQVRQQPKAQCYSTIEATHYIIDRFCNHSDRSHDNLLCAFEWMVQKQLSYYRCRSRITV